VWVLAVTVLLQSVALLARTEAWHLIIEAPAKTIEAASIATSVRRGAAQSGYGRASGTTKNAIAAYCSAAAAITSTWKTSW
jgi:hypothetical protein